LENIDTSALPEHGPEAVRPAETLEPGVPVDEKESNPQCTASATAELLRGVRDSAGAFGPLKSVARSLCLILDNSEVCGFLPVHSIRDAYGHSSKRR